MEQYLSFVTSAHEENAVLVVDISASMEESDYKPTRLRAAKKAARKLIQTKAEHFPHDRVGVIAYSSAATVVHPLAEAQKESRSLYLALTQLQTESTTNITAGLKTAASLLGVQKCGSPPGKVTLGRLLRTLFFETPQADSATPRQISGPGRIILLSDGAHNSGSPPGPVAERIRASGVTICAVGIAGSPDASGFDEDELRGIASPGQYCFIRDTQALIRKFEQLAGHIRCLEE